MHMTWVVEEVDARVFEMRCYVNGELAGGPFAESTYTLNTAALPKENEAQLEIGQYLAGVIDEVAFFNKALSASEVRSLFAWRDP